MEIDVIDSDPYLWLEDIEGERALGQVNAWNTRTMDLLGADPQFEEAKRRALEILNDKRKIAFPTFAGEFIYNFWRDEEHPRGLWRRTTLEDYLGGAPSWAVVLDVDALAAAEGVSWVFAGAVFLHSDFSRAMIALSDGGMDAAEYREFDLDDCTFVEGGFGLAAAKSSVLWADRDTLIVATDEGPDSLTAAGYPGILRRWRRGGVLAEAPVVARAAADEMLISIAALGDPRDPEYLVVRPKGPNEVRFDHLIGDRTVSAPLGLRDQISGLFGRRVIAVLGERLEAEGQSFPEGAMIAYDLDRVLNGGDPAWELVMPSPDNGAIEGDTITAHHVLVMTVEDVSARLTKLTRANEGGWHREPIPVPANVTAAIVAADWERPDYFYIETGFVTPTALHYIDAEGDDRIVAQQPARIDPDKFAVEQRFATSSDGTRIPYFLVRPNDREGPFKVRLLAYGGFRVSQLPAALGPSSLFWLEQGNAFVMANIRGGGEYGPAWHFAAIREKRQRAFDDLHAVAADLRANGIAAKIAMQGGSNGGLLAGVAYTQRPDLYDAIIMEVPLSDMRRYHRLLAGASWMGEYGDPDDPADWSFLKSYSPYHNIRADSAYPPLLLQTSTKDDRVHPGHARKMAARLEEAGHRFDYFENVEGGHGGAANAEQQAHIAALQLTWLTKMLA